MLEYLRPRVAMAEKAMCEQGLDAALLHLRRLSLADFGELMFEMPSADWPALSAALPRMASRETQQSWTGASGIPLLQDSTTFIRIVQNQFESIWGRPLRGAQVLDYGCGYGRLMRLMYYFCDPVRLYGVDPMQESLDLCVNDGILGHLAMSDYLPRSLPVGEAKFDVIYAYSVFTHTSRKATKTALDTLRGYVKSCGSLFITIRPVEYWKWHHTLSLKIAEEMERTHRYEQYAFLPHDRPAVDGDVTYGDTSIDPSWLEENCPQWQIRTFDRGLDPTQTIVVLLPQ